MDKKNEAGPPARRIAYFDATGELLLDLLRRISDLPAGARVVRLELDPPWAGRNEKYNVVRFYIESPELEPIAEGGLIPKLEPICHGDDDLVALIKERDALKAEVERLATEASHHQHDAFYAEKRAEKAEAELENLGKQLRILEAENVRLKTEAASR